MKGSLFLRLGILSMIGLYRVAAASSGTARSRAFSRSTNKLKASIDSVSSAKNVAAKPKPSAKKAAPKTAAAAATSSERSALSKLLSVPKDHPFAFQLMVATGKTSAADLVCQMVAEGKSLEEVDWRRNGIFVVFGFAYLGGFQYWLMVNKYRQWFPTMDKFAKMSFAEKLKYPAGIIDAGKMVLFDVIVHLPMIYFPSYYTVKEFVGGDSWNPAIWVKDGVGKYMKNYKEDLTAMIQLWGPSDCIQFVLPVHIRMPFRHLVSFFWTAYVSFTRGAIQAEAPPAAVPAVADVAPVAVEE